MKSSDVLKQSKKRTMYHAGMRTNEYIHSILFGPDLNLLAIEMGPNCNLRCFHCSAECGPEREGLPDPRVVDRAIREAIVSNVRGVCLTDGEPIRDENRDVMAEVAKFSGTIHVNILTNGKFAKTLDDAVDWIEFLKEKGLDLQESGSLNVSFGKMYPVSYDNYLNLNKALKKVYPKADYGKFFSYHFIGTGEGIDDGMRNLEVINRIRDVFGRRGSIRYGLNERDDPVVKVYPKKGSPIKIGESSCQPHGRAVNLPMFDDICPIKKLSPDDLYIEHEAGRCIVVTSDAEVYFGLYGGRSNKNNSYGSLKKSHLGDIIDRIRADPLFQAMKLGGVPLLYSISQKIEQGFVVQGRGNWDVARALFDNPSIRSGVRNYLNKNGVVDSYKDFINNIDLRRKTGW